MTDLVTVPAWALLLPWCLVAVAFVAGQVYAYLRHGRSIVRGNLGHVIGGKAALWGLAGTAVVVIGATR